MFLQVWGSLLGDVHSKNSSLLGVSTGLGSLPDAAGVKPGFVRPFLCIEDIIETWPLVLQPVEKRIWVYTLYI